jgi:hypothetical protein
MREEDLERFRMAFHEDEDPESAIARAMGIEISSVSSLAREIVDDLDGTKGGIGWWTGSGMSGENRVIVSDYLVAVVRSLTTNLIEANLHLGESVEAWDDIEFRARDQMNASGTPVPIPRSPEDLLSQYVAPLHVNGMLRALASTVDCLAGAIIGVLGLPFDIQTASWQALPRAESDVWRQLTNEQRRILMEIADDVKSAGPSDWLSWLFEMRNVLVHRGRRFVIYKSRMMGDGRLVLVTSQLGNLVVLEYLLPARPKEPDAQIWRNVGPNESLLTEPAIVTTRGLLRSVNMLTESVAQRLLGMWRMRRTNPGLIQQPFEQLKKQAASRAVAFRGYEPGTSSVSVELMTANVEFATRLAAASVGDPIS